MSVPGQLEDANNREPEQNYTSEDELTRIFRLTKGELEVLLIRTVERLIGPLMEHLVRTIVKEKLEFLQENLMTSIKCNCGKQLGTSESRCLQLKFLDKISLPVFTGKKIKGEGCTSIRVALVDSLTGEVVKSGREAKANVELVVLEGDSSGDGGDNWTVENFKNEIVEARKGKKSILKGHTYLNLKEGIGNIGEIYFIHNSGWMKRCKLRLGARVVDDFPGTTIKATKTESFILKDCRTSLYVKNHPPSLSDEVWRLEKIGRKGAFRKRLSGENITTVKDFLKLLIMNPQRLKKILGAGAKTWEVITDHARTCMIDDVVHLYYYPNSQQKMGVVFNVVGHAKGLVKESQYVLIDNLSEKEKGNAQKWVIRAFGHWNEVISFDDENCFMKSFSHFSESPRPESGNVCNCEPPPMMNTQPGKSSHGIIPSISCTGESSRLNGSHPGSDDFMEDLLNIPGQGSYGPLYSPDSVIRYFDEREYLQFLNNNINHHQPENPAVADKTSPGILLVGSQANNSVNIKVQRRWRRVFMVLIAIGKTIGPPERIHVHKKQRVS